MTGTSSSSAGTAGKPRIAILGGGVGAVTAAFHLSQPGWGDHFESITIYQQGWRLGGKGASGRGAGDRIEEHGLHVWFGFYENAFRMLHRCHQDLDEMAASDPDNPDLRRWPLEFLTMENSFKPCTEITLTDYDGCGWKLWTADFFDWDDDRPWADPDALPPSEQPDQWTVAFYVVRCLRLAGDMAWSLIRSDPGLEIAPGPVPGIPPAALDDGVGAVWSALGGDLRRLLHVVADTIDALAEEMFDQPLVLRVLDLVMRVLDFAVEFLRRRYDSLVRESDTVRRAYYLVDLLIAVVRGVIEDGVIQEDSFDVIDHVDFRDWLLAHGAARESVDCALVRAVVYDLAFGYVGGDPQKPACGAGTALRGLLRTFFTYRGALMWKMNAGMGDVVFAPLYERLVKRGVEIRFFHRVEAVHAAYGAVEQIDIDVQANVPAETKPQAFLGAPAAAMAGQWTAVWPAVPGVFKQAKWKAIPAEDYESWYVGGANKAGTKVLRRGEDFDLVVFGLPISCVPLVAPGLVAQSKRWKGAVAHLLTVPTQAMQLWLNQPASQAGDWKPGAVVGGFVEPHDTWADMSHLEPVEKVPGAQTVAYFCNVLDERDDPPPERGYAQQWRAAQKALVRANAVRFLRHDIGKLWPGAIDPVSGEFRWEWLVAPDGVAGVDRLDAQYLRANVEPSERYVLSVPGSSAYRIAPADTGFANLYAVGDWTSCTLNAGCVEAAVISGMLAANGIHQKYGDPGNVEPIVGEDHA